MRVRQAQRWAVFAMLALLALAVSVALAQGDGDNPPPTPFYETNDDPALNAQMDHVEQATAILRDLEPLGPVTRAFITRDELLAYLAATMDRDYPPQAARDDVIFYHAFGFMGLDVDLRQVQLDVLAEQIGGFYDSDLQAMFVISSSDDLSAMNQVLYAHEYTHALQDQHFDLGDMGMDEEDYAANPDRALALQGLAEGDAMLMTEGYEAWLLRSNPLATFDMLGDAFGLSMEALASAPQIVQTELMFPYTDGRNFAYALFSAGGGWSMVDAAYSSPPVSTEQILHPEAYLNGEEPVAVTVPALDDLLGEGWREVWDRTLGEFYLREYLHEKIDRGVAGAAAAGWGGDRYRIYFNDATAETAMIWRTVWDTPEDADEFAGIYTDFNAMRYHGNAEAVDPATTCWQDGDALCMRTGETETLVATAPRQSLALDILDLGTAGQ